MPNIHINELWRERIIKKGKTSFLIRRGVIRWGLSTAILYSIITFLFDNNFLFSGLVSYKFVKELMSSLIIFPIVGFFMGMFLWNIIIKQSKGQQKE
jgi:phosphate/sulfate permease